jgi:regulatory protein
MTVTSVKRGADPDLLKIGLSDGSLFFIRLCYLPKAITSRLEPFLSQGGAINVAISEEEQEALLFASECVRLERKALQLIGRAEQSRQGLQYKLEGQNSSEGAAKTVLDRLVALDLVNDRRFATAWINAQLGRSRTKSASQLISGLMRRGIDGQVATELVKERYPAELETEAIRAYLHKKRIDSGALSSFELKQILHRAHFSKKAISLFIDKE